MDLMNNENQYVAEALGPNKKIRVITQRQCISHVNIYFA